MSFTIDLVEHLLLRVELALLDYLLLLAVTVCVSVLLMTSFFTIEYHSSRRAAAEVLVLQYGITSFIV